MRTTITLDADVRRSLEEAMRRQGISFKQALNDAIRRGLATSFRGKRPFVQETYSLGAAQLFRGEKALAVAAIEDEELLRKLSH